MHTGKDSLLPYLLAAVCDRDQSSTTLHLVFGDSLQEVLPELSKEPKASDPQGELQFYLELTLALISVLFLLMVVLAIAL